MAGIGNLATSIARGGAYQSTPGGNPLTIGPVTFNSDECPSELPIGALESKLSVTEFLGGGRDVQFNGAQPKAVAWKGTLWQPLISERKNTLRAMMVSGQEFALTWMDERYFCKIKSFTPTANHANRCPYEIEVEITRASNGALSNATVPTVDQQVSALTANLQQQNSTIVAADPTGSASLQSPLNAAIAAIAQASPIAQLVAPQLTSLIATLTTASTAVSTYLGTISEGASQYVATAQLLSSLNLIVTNVQRGQVSRSVRVQGLSLFELAAQFYGEPSYAFALAEVNGLPSPQTSRLVPQIIALPPYPKASP